MQSILCFPKRLFNSWRGRDVGLALLVITLNAETVSKGNCVNDRYVEPGGECCTNFYLSNGECIACPAGSYGDNCSTTCPYPSYGENCGHQCVCSSGEECNPFKGCVKITTASPILPTTIPHDSVTAITSIKSGKDESTQNAKAETKPILDNSEIKSKTSSTASSGVIVKTTIEPTSGNSQTMLVIIITGSVLSVFLIIIIINQIHGKLRRKRINMSTNQKTNSDAPNQPEEEAYFEINECGMLGNISNYDKMEPQPSIKQKRNEEILDIISDGITRPMLPGRKDQVIESKSKNSIVEEDQELGEGHRSAYLDVISVTPNESSDNSYLKPVDKINTYAEVIGSPPKGSTESESNIGNESKAAHDLDSIPVCLNELCSPEGTYLEVLHQ